MAIEAPVIDLGEKVAVVTGASRGIGACIAATLAKAGADVTIVDLDEENGRRIVGEIHGTGRKALFVKADVSSAQDVDRLFGVVQANFSRIDIMVNNAGIWFRKPFLEISDSEWDQVLATNLKGTFMCTQRATRIMMTNRSGCIISIASQAGIYYSRGQGVHYAASKAAIVQLTRALAFELGPFGIRINAIAPGGTVSRTPPSPTSACSEAGAVVFPQAALDASTTQPESSRPIGGTSPLRRRGEPQDIAQAALFLASNMADFITGQTLVVNGGGMGNF